MPKDGNNYSFLAGEYLLSVYIEPVEENPRKIFEQKLELTKQQQEEMLTKMAGTYFDWAPNTQNYFSHVDSSPKKDNELSDLIKILTDDKK